MIRSLLLFSQEGGYGEDSLHVGTANAVFDSLYVDGDSLNVKRISDDAIDKKVSYTATGYIKTDFEAMKSILVGNAEVTYDDIKITADSIVFDMNTNEVFAVGVSDSSGTVAGSPVLDVGSQHFESDTLRYNFKSKKAYARTIVTEQNEGYLNSSVAKLLDDGSSNIYKSTYSTCDADTPHFYINLEKAKIYPGKKIISGPANLVFEGIPIPVYLPFGYFPIQTKKAATGILVPKFHYEQARGYALSDGGFYFAGTEHFDLALQGSIFTNGTWQLTGKTSYSKRYKYSGSLSFSYANNVNGHKGLDDYSQSSNYSFSWAYSQNAKAHPGSRFSANVNMSSSGYDKNNSYNLQDHITTQKSSSISYSKSWAGTPFNFSASMNHSQNTSTKAISLNLPKISFTMSRIYPFKGKVVRNKWYEDIQLQYSASINNKINTYDSLMFTPSMWKNMDNGFMHQIPISIQFNPFKNFSISPSLTYKGVMYTQKMNKTWNPDYVDPETNLIHPAVVTDTLKGLFYGHAVNPTISVSYNPQIFGMFIFTNPRARVPVIRHVMKPSVSFSYTPYFQGLSSKMYRKVQSDEDGTMTEYSIFSHGIYGTPSLSSRSGIISLSLTNIVEAKAYQKRDTTGEPQKVKIIDNLGLSTSYNVFADSMKWSPVSLVFRTTLAKKINLSANSRFSLYGLNEKGANIGTFYYKQTGKLLRMNSFTTSASFSLSDLLNGKNNSKQGSSSGGSESGAKQREKKGKMGGSGGDQIVYDEFGYSDFKMPWTMNVNYSLTYTKTRYTPILNQTVSINGNVTLTKNTSITYRTGYDFNARSIATSQIGITRELHCWGMSFSWIPSGAVKSWQFSIRAKGSLSDLKYERRKDYHDNR